MRAQVRGLDQASRNSQDGISMIQTAEGALNETHSILQRMRELAVQSSNDTNTVSDRAEIQKEVDELAKEITRISNDTEFNTQKLINGDASGVTFQVGANSNQNISISFADMSADALGVGQQSFTAATVQVEGEDVSVIQDASGNTVGTWRAAVEADEENDVAGQEAGYYNESGALVAAAATAAADDATVEGPAKLDVSSRESADAAISTIQSALDQVSAERSKLGATQNRLEHTISNLDNSSENIQAAESRIRDVDMAKEIMEFTKQNILSQASQSMLAQANQAPQQVLQLLG